MATRRSTDPSNHGPARRTPAGQAGRRLTPGTAERLKARRFAILGNRRLPEDSTEILRRVRCE
jgi:hypothetical protein